MKLIKEDLDFIWAQLRLLNNTPLTPLDSTGIRDVQGVGNNIFNPFWGSADTLFPRLTYNSLLQTWDPVTKSFSNGYTAEVGGFVFGDRGALTYDSTYKIDYATRGTTIFDASPRIISNLLSSQDDLSAIQVLDDPSASPGGRLSPLTGNVNPLPYSSYMTLFGQFFDHGLDFVHKGVDGSVFVPLLPGDGLYDPTSHTNFMIASRTNTVNVTIGEGSTDNLVSQLGLPTEGTPNWSVVTGTNPLGGTYTGTLVINNQIIQVSAVNATALVSAINAATPETGVTASIVNSRLVLTPATGESFNTISPFIDLSQSYGSVASHTVFLREYDAYGKTTGRLVSGGTDKDKNGTPDGMATWADIKANALKIGITLHDYNVESVPLVRLNADGSTYYDADGKAWLVALNKTSGAIVYVQDTAKDTLAANNLVLMTTGHAFLDDMAHGVLSALDAKGDVLDPTKKALLEAHFIAGDGRANENIGLTAIHDVFHSEHNRLVEWIKSNFQKDGDAYVLDAQGRFLDADGKAWSTEDLFQAAKFITEMEYQHLVFGEFSRKLSPNINAFAGYDITLDAAISAEFAHAVYRFGHSMLTETVDLTKFNSDGIATEAYSMGLIAAFLNPKAYTDKTAGEVALGMSMQVGNAIDEWMTDALRDNLVGLPLDLAVLNIVRGRDSGIPSLNEVRLSLFTQTGMTSLKPYESWDEFGMNLLHPESLLNFIMAYARDDVLLKFGTGATGANDAEKLAYWNNLQFTDHKAYGAALKAAAVKAFDDDAFMTGGNKDFWDVDLWIGGLAEKKVTGGMLGATFDFIFATQMIKLQDGDRFYYLERLLGTNLLLEIEGQLFADIVMRNTGVAHLYPDIFTVPDNKVEMSVGTQVLKNTYAALLLTTTVIKDAYNVDRTIGTAGFVGDTFYGNPGNYLDARGVFNPNGVGNASEIIGGTSANDKINGLGGNDAIYGDGGHDTIEGGFGNDFLRGGADNDVITDEEGDDLIWGDEGNDWINAGNGLDQVFGGEGNDTLYGGLGGDVVDGGAGDDIVYGDNGAGATVTITRDANGKITGVTVVGTMDPTGDADVIDGGAGDDVLFGGGGADVLNGGVGDDWLIGGGGADAMIGWDGNDRFIMDAGDIGFNHAMDGGLGFDIVDYSLSIGNDNLATRNVREGISINLSNAGAAVIPVGVNVMDTYLSVEGVIGSAYNDTLVGGAAVQLDQGGLPIPLLDANGNPVQLTQIDPVTLLPVPVFDAFGNPVWVTIPVDFYLDGRDGNDLLVGDAGNDTLIGGAGNDTLVGGLGNDTASYAHATNNVTVNLNNQGFQANGVTRITQNTGGGGTDALESIENVIGGSGNDTLTGDALNNFLAGGSGNDSLVGNAGNDTLMGGAGNDTLNGGAGIDTVSYADASGNVTVSLALTTAQGTGGAGTDTLALFENLTGGAFNDALTGDGANNVIDGGAGNDTINAAGGNDTLIGGAGNDNLNGGAGTDTAVFSGRLADYRITYNGATAEFTIEDLRAGSPDGRDVVTLVENFQFADRTVAANVLIPPVVNFSTPSVVLNEGNTGTTNFTFTVTLSGVSATATAIPWTVSAVTASADDFANGVLPSGTLTIAAGATQGTITIGVRGDTLKEGNETFSVVLGTPSGSALLGAAATATGTITNDDLPTASVSATTLSQNESAQTYTFTVTLSEALAAGESATVQYAVAGSGASPATAADFVGGVFPAGTITFTAGEAGRTQTVTVTVDNDDLLENNETFTFTISSPGGDTPINIGTASLTATIVNDDQNIEGTANADTLNGNALANHISGLAGNDVINGLAGADTLDGGTGNDTLNGGADNDTLFGADGNDSLDGGTGGDSMVGGAGDDTYVVDDAGDKVVELAYEGTDTVRTSIDYTLSDHIENLVFTGTVAFTGNGNDGANSITGGNGNDTLDGFGGNDTLIGGAGNDVLIGGAGNDSLDGGAGTADVADFEGRFADYAITINANGSLTVVDTRTNSPDGTDTVTNIEILRFSDGDVLVTSLQPAIVTVSSVTAAQAEGNNPTGASYTFTLTLSRAFPGAQTLTWTVLGTGTNPVDGYDFSGNTLPTGTVTFNANATTATVTVTVEDDDQLEANETFTLALSNLPGLLTTTGAAASAIATVNNDDNTLNGDGRETVTQGIVSHDNLVGNANANAIYGHGGNDTLNGGDGNDTLDGGDGNDSLLGGNGNDSLLGGAGDDTLDGGVGNDTMAGGAGDDVYVVDSATDVVTEAASAGNDTVRTTLTAYTLGGNLEGLIYTGTAAFAGTGNTADNRLEGSTGVDTLLGLAGNDTLLGGAGNDILRGGAGSDQLYGGAGSDQFIFDSRVGSDKVWDFNAGDLLAFSRTEFTALGNAINNRVLLISATATEADNANQRLIYNTTTGNLYYDADGLNGTAAVLVGTITTDGTTAANLTASSFITVAS